MNKKHVILTVSLALALLFLSTVGSFYTSYTILQEDISLDHYPFPFVKNNNYNSLYIVLPNSYTLDEYQAANDVANGLKLAMPLPPEIVTESSLPEGTNNLILVGDPCTNSLIAYYTEISDCSLGLSEGEGLLQLINNERSSVLVVLGYDLTYIKKAAKVLSNYNSYALKGSKVVVSGSLSSPLQFVLKFL